MKDSDVVLRLPQWVDGYVAGAPGPFAGDQGRMEFVVGLAQENVRRRTGGPFGAAVFEAGTGRVMGAGVNLVESLGCSLFHAEMVAIAMAQKAAETYDLSTAGVYELVTSVEPCAMCLGAIGWSGVKRVVCGAPGTAAEAIGFDEGHKPTDWVAGLQRRGIEVVQDVLAEQAVDVLRQYAAAGGLIYNPGSQG